MATTKVTANLLGGYNVLLDGVQIGHVFKRSERYNLARPVTVHWWRVDGDVERVHHRTRRDAVAALVEAHTSKEKN